MNLGFYEFLNTLNKQPKRHIIYVYSNKPFEAIDVVSGECSSYWDIEKFIFCDRQEEMAKKWDWIFDIDILKDKSNEYINS